MANTIKTLMDTDWRVQAIITLEADTNGSGLTWVDVSGLNGHENGSLLAISKLFWVTDSPAAGVTLSWGGTGGTLGKPFVLLGNGSYGMTAGQPAIVCDRTSSTAATSDIILTNAAAMNGMIVVECTKHQNNLGIGWGG